MFFNKSLKSLSDEVLMNKVQEGSERALVEIYRRYGHALLRYFFRMLWRDKSKAEDFLHDLFIRIIEKSHQFDPSKKFATWIYSMAHNMCKNEYRKQAFRRSVQMPVSTHDFANEFIVFRLDHHAFEKKLDVILKKEEEETRSIFFLRHELEMTFSEIADILHCPEGTVKSRLFYLKKKLASELDDYKIMLER